jgi:hypothetical protein
MVRNNNSNKIILSLYEELFVENSGKTLTPKIAKEPSAEPVNLVVEAAKTLTDLVDNTTVYNVQHKEFLDIIRAMAFQIKVILHEIFRENSDFDRPWEFLSRRSR